MTSCVLLVLGLAASCQSSGPLPLESGPTGSTSRPAVTILLIGTPDDTDCMSLRDGDCQSNVVLAGPRHVDVRPVYNPLRPAPRPAHKFYDRPAKLELVAWGIVGGADLGQTCHALANGWQEDWIPTQRCVGLVAVSLGAIAVVELVSWALHRHGHHKLERLPRLAGIGFNAAGLVYSGRHGAFSIP